MLCYPGRGRCGGTNPDTWLETQRSRCGPGAGNLHPTKNTYNLLQWEKEEEEMNQMNHKTFPSTGLR